MAIGLENQLSRGSSGSGVDTGNRVDQFTCQKIATVEFDVRSIHGVLIAIQFAVDEPMKWAILVAEVVPIEVRRVLGIAPRSQRISGYSLSILENCFVAMAGIAKRLSWLETAELTDRDEEYRGGVEREPYRGSEISCYLHVTDSVVAD